MLKMMEKYANNLEELVAEKTKQLTDEKKKTDLLLYRMLPGWVLIPTDILAAMKLWLIVSRLFDDFFQNYSRCFEIWENDSRWTLQGCNCLLFGHLRIYG